MRDSGGEAASLREAPLPPDPLFRRAVGVWLVRSFLGGSACWVGAVPFKGYVSTAADRAAADVQRLGFRPVGRLGRYTPHASSTRRVPYRRQVTAALSAAVTTAPPIGDASPRRQNPLRRNAHPNRQPLFGRGPGEALLSEKRPPPAFPVPPPTVFPGGSAREGPFVERPPPSQYPLTDSSAIAFA